MNIKLAIDGNIDSLNIVKLCILYFDQVTVEIPSYIESVEYDSPNLRMILKPFLCSDLVDQLDYLRNNKIISIDLVEYNKTFTKIRDEQIANYIHRTAEKIILKFKDDIYDNMKVTDNNFSFKLDTMIKSDELKNIIDNIPLEDQKSLFKKTTTIKENISIEDIQDSFYKCYYCFRLLENLLSSIFYNLYEGEVSVSNSKTINSMLFKYYNDQQIHDIIKNSLNLNCASILLPNLSNTTFDEILELKHKAKDELIELRSFIELLNVNYDAENTKNINELIIQKINPSIRNFEYKIKDIKLNVAQKFITEFKNPLSYAPLLGTIFGNVPQYISLMFSSALIGTSVGLEYLKQLNNIKKDNMYFLFKLHKMI